MRVRTAQALDDLAERCIRLMHTCHPKAQEALDDYREPHQEPTEALIPLLSQLVSGWQTRETAEEPLQTMGALLGADGDTMLARCEASLASAGNHS